MAWYRVRLPWRSEIPQVMSLRPEGGFDTPRRVENENGLEVEIKLSDLRIWMQQGLAKTESSDVV